ncbi:MAG: hypothetical protein S4CHLAM37_11910 [Chlamydiia bacterium]|nr:hypothetical protein [Chlamydiia bacterium]
MGHRVGSISSGSHIANCNKATSGHLENQITKGKQSSYTASHVKEAPKWETALKTKHAAKMYSCYMLFLTAVNHLQLIPIQNHMVQQANLMNVEHAVQQKLLTISKFIATIKNSATSGGTYSSYDYNVDPAKAVFDPRAFNGLVKTYYDVSAGSGSFGQEKPSADYVKGVKGFVKAFRELFYANTDSKAPKFEELCHIKNPNILPSGKDFDLTAFWGKLNSKYAAFNCGHYNVFATKPSEHASLIQQYCYAKAQVVIASKSKKNVNGANGELNKSLVNFDVTDVNCDPILKATMQTVSTLEAREKVARDVSYVSYNTQETTEGLNLILNRQYTPFASYADEGASVSGKQDGLYGYFAKAAFNYFWEKNPQSTNSPKGSAPAGVPAAGFSSWSAVKSKGVSLDNLAGSLEENVNALQTNYGQSVGQGSVSAQALTTNEGQDVNIVQTGLKGKKQVDSTMLQNQKV